MNRNNGAEDIAKAMYTCYRHRLQCQLHTWPVAEATHSATQLRAAMAFSHVHAGLSSSHVVGRCRCCRGEEREAREAVHSLTRK
mmetsp:Transcript_10006/g.21391  ORF Transcript_10006/g.21391 Transcript_10006/m.21391 type:complete len:84 (-) Transcript_10006:1433-1684(-)